MTTKPPGATTTTIVNVDHSQWPPDGVADAGAAAGGVSAPRGPGDAPRLTPERIRTAVMIVAALLAMTLVVVAMRPDPMSDAAPASPASPSTTSGEPTGEPDHGGEDEPATRTIGRASQRLDQPIPVPGYRWRGWSRYPEGRCAWMPAALREQLQLISEPVPQDTTCTMTLREGTQAHITWGRPTTPVVWDPTGQRRRSTIVGLPARTATAPLFHYILFHKYPGICKITVNTRSTTALSVLTRTRAGHWPPCETARDVIELVARSMIPTAGGTPWPDTPQRPAPAAIADHSPCDLLEGNLAGLGGLTDDQPRVQTDDVGETCTYGAGDTSASAWLTTAGALDGLAQVRPLRPRAATTRLLATLPAREEQLRSSGCALTIEITPDQLLRITYHSKRHPENACGAADVIAGRTVQAALDRTDP